MGRVPVTVEYGVRAVIALAATATLLYSFLWIWIVLILGFSLGDIHFIGGDPSEWRVMWWGFFATGGAIFSWRVLRWTVRPSVARRRGSAL